MRPTALKIAKPHQRLQSERQTFFFAADINTRSTNFKYIPIGEKYELKIEREITQEKTYVYLPISKSDHHSVSISIFNEFIVQRRHSRFNESVFFLQDKHGGKVLGNQKQDASQDQK